MKKIEGRNSEYVNLAASELGAVVLFTNDDFFASADNLLKPEEPIWLEDEYTDRGKWMDGWESRRQRREPSGFDYCFIKLGLPGKINEVLVDTAFFTGNYPDSCSIEGTVAHPNATPAELESASWRSLLVESKLEGGSKNWFDISDSKRVTHLRLKIYPDGGVARLRIYGEVLPDVSWLDRLGVIDLASINYGARKLSQSDMYFGDANNLLKPSRGINMGDGWESKRRRGPGYDWVTIKLAGQGDIERVVIDTNHFKGNYPDRFSLEFTSDADPETADWHIGIVETKLQAHIEHIYDVQLNDASFVRLNIFPDGGVSRLRLFGTLTQSGRKTLGLSALESMHEDDLKRTFLSCCGSQAWASQMARVTEFDEQTLNHAATRAFDRLATDDWLEAFRAHPRIGGKKAEDAVTSTSASWSTKEQSSMSNADEDLKRRMAEANDAYFDKHDFIYIVCATGKSPQEMLKILEERLSNATNTEIENAAEEQKKITEIRLNRLLVGN